MLGVGEGRSGGEVEIIGVVKLKREERKVTVKFLETEQMNTYKILAEFFTKKFNENWFDKVEQK